MDDRLYILSSIYTDYRLRGETGPSMLISDPVLALRWYLRHEREEGLAVAGQVSEDGGLTWRPLPISELYADADRAVPGAQREALLRDALAGEAAEIAEGKRLRGTLGRHRPPRVHRPPAHHERTA
ncbi:hypothetical protein ACWGQ5_53610, partial [Streptomyces sp. NPDC055722]